MLPQRLHQDRTEPFPATDLPETKSKVSKFQSVACKATYVTETTSNIVPRVMQIMTRARACTFFVYGSRNHFQHGRIAYLKRYQGHHHRHAQSLLRVAWRSSRQAQQRSITWRQCTQRFLQQEYGSLQRVVGNDLTPKQHHVQTQK